MIVGNVLARKKITHMSYEIGAILEMGAVPVGCFESGLPFRRRFLTASRQATSAWRRPVDDAEHEGSLRDLDLCYYTTM